MPPTVLESPVKPVLPEALGYPCPPHADQVTCPSPVLHRPVARPYRKRFRPRSRPPVSLALKGIERGEPFVPPQGNVGVGYRAAKRLLDILGATVLLLALSPLLATVWLVLMFTTRGRPFFVQRRIGYLGRPFPMIKFRTMRLDAESVKHTVRNEVTGPVFKNRCDPRITRLGRWLRKTSLDETPQLINVLLGQMSLVGPRPLPVAEVARFQRWQRKRLTVKPGLTCLWQVSGRSEIGFDDWARMDIWYVRNQSLWTDCMLLFSTPWSVVTCRGAY
ncbi:MAG: sugar transferase [Planctomycetota bacterium]